MPGWQACAGEASFVPYSQPAPGAEPEAEGGDVRAKDIDRKSGCHNRALAVCQTAR